MQPTRRQVPPSSGSCSTQTTLAPSCAARIAAVYPPGPPPSTATSHFIAADRIAGQNGVTPMKLEGIHHVTCITGDAPANVEFYAGTLGLRLVKKTVNQDDPTVYHLFYADEQGSAGADITFFEYPGAPRGRAGDGMVHRVVFRVASEEALDFWAERAGGERDCGSVADPRSRGARARARRRRLGRRAADRRASRDPARARAARLRRRSRLLVGPRPQRDVPLGARLHARLGGARRDSAAASTSTTSAPEARGLPGAGTVHHVAWASTLEEHEAWRERVASIGGQPTPVIDRFYFRSIYFREPSGVLFEIATLGPGLHRRRAARDARRAPLAAARLRAAPRRARAAPDAAPEPAAGRA